MLFDEAKCLDTSEGNLAALFDELQVLLKVLLEIEKTLAVAHLLYLYDLSCLDGLILNQ